MPRILFWNINKRNLLDQVISLTKQENPDVIILAESEIDDDSLLEKLNRGRDRIFYKDINISKRIKFYSVYRGENFQLVSDEDYFSIRKMNPFLGGEILLVAVHLPSKLHAEPIDQLMAAQYLSKSVRSTEVERKTTRTVVIGDFNMSPFEDGMIAANGLHAMLDQKISRKISRKVKGIEYPFFYNPMWGRLGDLTEGPSGTHRYSKAIEVNYIWHTYDQVLIRPQLLKYFKHDDLKVVNFSGSDHYPISFNLKTEVVDG